MSLNVIALESTAKLIQGVLDLGANLVAAYVDTVGDPDKYRAMLSKKFPSIAFTVSKKADSLFPIVSAASVVAKVRKLVVFVHSAETARQPSGIASLPRC